MISAQTIDTLTLIGNSDASHQIYKMIGRLCNADCSVLLIGEQGTGRKTVARALHYYSNRAASPFHIFSGTDLKEASDEDFLGLDERHSSDSTYYIQNWPSLSMFVQNQILRIINTREYHCSHQHRSRKHNFRFIAEIGPNLKEEMEQNNVPWDIFYDWNFVPLLIPPLRERKADIPVYAEHFLKLHAEKMKVSVKELSPEAKDVLLAYNWPGNMDELRDTLNTALQNCRGSYIRAEHLPALRNHFTQDQEIIASLEMFLNTRLSSYIHSLPPSVEGNLYPFLVPLLEKSVFAYALRKSKGNKNKAAELLGLHRNTLNKKLQRMERR